MSKWVPYYSVLMGVLQAATWIILFINGTVAQYYAGKPVETIFLLLAEFLTAGAMILGGWGVLAGRKWGAPLNLAALGMMEYCVIFSCGVFGQLGILPAAAWFGLAAAANTAAIAVLLGPHFWKPAVSAAA